MLMVKRVLVSVGLLMASHSIYAAVTSVGACIEGLTFNVGSNDQKYAAWQEGFDTFFSSASQSDSRSILESYSRLDGSQDNIAEQMAKMDKFERYAQTKYSMIEQDALVWGSYWLRNVTYQYRGSNIVLTEPMLCEQGSCKMTTLSENGDADSQLISLLLRSIGTSRQSSACANDQKGGTIVKLLPSYRGSDQRSINLQFTPKQAVPLNDLKHINAYIEQCGLELSENQSDSKLSNKVSVKAGCLSGNLSTLIPVIELREDGEQNTVFIGVDVLMRLLATPDSIQQGISFNLSTSETLLLKLKSAIGNEYIVVLPFQSKDKISLDLMVGAQATVLLRNEVINAFFINKNNS